MTTPAADSSESLVVVDAQHPWPGLMAFTEEARGFFHGRDSEAGELLRLIRRETLTVLFGQSGLGKSSLLNAGVFPRLRETEHLPIYVRLDLSDGAPPLVAQVFDRVAASAQAQGVEAPAAAPGTTLWGFFHQRDGDFWSARNRLLTPVLVFDQFEEIFTLGRHSAAAEARANAFIDELADLVEGRMPAPIAARLEADPNAAADYDFARRGFKVVLSFREDYLPDFEGLRSKIRAVLQNRMRLQRMGGAAAMQAIRQPGSELVSDEVAQQIVRFVAAARPGRDGNDLARLDIEPALLSVVCRELNQRRLASGAATITADLLGEGAQQRIIADFYEASWAGTDARLRQFVEDQLLTDAGYRDSVPLDDALAAPGVTRAGVDRLIGRRLLHLEDRSGALRVELTHDLLADVARASRDARKAREALQRQQQAEAARKRRQRRLAVAGAVAFVAMAGIAAVFAVLLDRAERERQRGIETQSSMMLSRANAALEQGTAAAPYAMLAQALVLNPANQGAAARAVGLLAQRRHPQLLWQVELRGRPQLGWAGGPQAQALLWSGGDLVRLPGAQSRGQRVLLRAGAADHRDHGLLGLQAEGGAGDALAGIAWRSSAPPADTDAVEAGASLLQWHEHANAVSVLSGGLSVHLFDAASLQPLGWRWALPQPAAQLMLSAGRRWCAVQLADGGLLLSRTDAPARPLALPQRALATLAGVTDDGAVLVHDSRAWQWWDAAATPARLLAEGPLRAGGIGVVAHSAGGDQLAFADGSLVIVLATGGAPRRFAHAGTVRALAFSPDGRLLASGTLDRQAQIWQLDSERPAGPPLRHQGPVLALRFGGNGKVLATAGGDGAVRLWDLARGELLAEPMVHPAPVVDIALQPGGEGVLALTANNQLFLWRGDDAQANPRRDIALPARAGAGASGPDLLVQAAEGGALAAWRLQAAGAEPLWSQPAGAAAVSALALAPAADRLAVARRDGSLAWLEAASGRVTGLARSPAPAVLTQLVFSPDGRRLAARGDDGVVRIWEAGSGSPQGWALPAEDRGELVFSNNGRELLVVEGERARHWELATGRLLGSLQGSEVKPGDDIGAADAGPARQAGGTGTGPGTGGVSSDPIVWAGRLPAGQPGFAVVTRRWLLRMQPRGASAPGLAGAGGRRREALSLGDLQAWSVAASGDGARLAIGALDGRVRLVDLATLQFSGETLRHDDAVLGGRFAPDGRRLATWSRDRVLRLWDVPGGHTAGDPVLAPRAIADVDFAPGGQALRVWFEPEGAWLQRVGQAPQGPVPPWLPGLLEATGGSRLDANGEATRLPDRMAAFDSALRAVQAATGAWADWGREVLLRLHAAPAAASASGAVPAATWAATSAAASSASTPREGKR
jgi:WD40 repeat protein